MKRAVERLEQKAEAEALEQPLHPTERHAGSDNPQELQRQARIRDLPQNATPCLGGSPPRKLKR